MIPQKIYAVYFSPVESTKQIVCAVAETMAEEMSVDTDIPVEEIDFTLPAAREKTYRFAADELVIFGTPTYAGRVPNKILPFVQDLFSAEHTPAVSVVTFGNRSFDSSLTELTEEMGKNGFQVFAAAAFACRHVFSDKIAAGRPDEEDMDRVTAFAGVAAEKLLSADDAGSLTQPVILDGAPVAPYYTPLGIDGNPAVFLKAKPVTDPDRCIGCGVCAGRCPLGSIDFSDFTQTPGLCIKCHACIRLCPTGARSFTDEAFLSHVAYLESHFTARKDGTTFF